MTSVSVKQTLNSCNSERKQVFPFTAAPAAGGLKKKKKVELTDGFVRCSEWIVLRRPAVTGGQEQKVVGTKQRFKQRNLHLVQQRQKTKKINQQEKFFHHFYIYVQKNPAY